MPDLRPLNPEAIEVIRLLGGNAKAAEFCEVSTAAISQWRHNGLPKHQRKFLRLARPEVLDGAAEAVKTQ